MGAGLTAPSTSTSALPQPGIGPHPVGMVDVMTAEGANGDTGIFARPDAATFDCLTREGDDHLPYWIERKEYIAGMVSQLKTVSKRGQWLAEWIIGERRIRCVKRAALATTDTIPSRLPVILFSHGVGESRHQHSSLCSALASHGYVVAAIEHRDYSACWTYKLAPECVVTSASSIRGGRAGRVEKPMTFLDIGEHDGKRENKTRNQQVHKRVAECVRLFHFLEECDLGLINRCPCCPSTSSSSSSASSSDTTSMFSFSSEESDQMKRRRSRGSRGREGCRLPLHTDSGASRLVLGEEYEWGLFADRLDLTSSVIMGVGLGAATALACCSFTTDFQKAIALDATLRPLGADVYTRVVQPILFLNRPGGAAPEAQAKFEDAESITLMDAEPHTFSDLPLLLRPVLGRRLRLNGATDADQMAETVVRVCAAFLQTPTAGPASSTRPSSLPSPSSMKAFLLEQHFSCNPFPPLTPVPDDTEIFL
ncbi:paf-1 [Pristionchus pacificus]|uniref:1-alkyl-2-acetylglycerophosphocholine esterase n=1 Tax=Pristionchus pacificus TaxID=54126 RepID=A0A2A6C7P7_PRIPA|nr:paf-1 [Pristionchus pacificus]|eukprot:PDM74098.1 paf-1 [Pristionchus pacificus]